MLLAEGIGDTLRISLAADPVDEVHAAFHMLQALGLREGYARVVACPTCGRVEVDVMSLAAKVEELAKDLPPDRVISVMGCIVNGPGEAKAADLGIAAGKTKVAIYRQGELHRNIDKADLERGAARGDRAAPVARSAEGLRVWRGGRRLRTSVAGRCAGPGGVCVRGDVVQRPRARPAAPPRSDWRSLCVLVAWLGLGYSRPCPMRALTAVIHRILRVNTVSRSWTHLTGWITGSAREPRPKMGVRGPRLQLPESYRHRNPFERGGSCRQRLVSVSRGTTP